VRAPVRHLAVALAGSVALAGIAVVGAAGSLWLNRGLPAVRLACADVGGISPRDAMALVPAGVLWVDARLERDHEVGHLAGAVCVNEMNWEAQVSALVFAWRPAMRVVVYADRGDAGAARRVAALVRVAIGLRDVVFLDGNWRDLGAAFGIDGGAP